MTRTLPYIALLAFLLCPFAGQSQYCTPTANCVIGDGIRLVSIGAFSNISDCEADLGVPGYGDFTALPGMELGQGVTYEGLFRSDYASQQFSIWIDGNADFEFSADEIIMSDVIVGTEITAASLTIPTDLAFGSYRMRIKATWNGTSSGDACVQGTYGESEDYTITVVEPPTCLNVSGLTIDALSSTSITLSWTDPGTATVWDLEYGPVGFTPVGFPSPGFDDTTNPASITGLDPLTDYDFYIRADCGMDNITDVSIWTSPFTVTTACGAAIPNYLEDFNSGLGNCWELFGNGDLTTGPLQGDFTSWFDDGFANIPNVFQGSQGIYVAGNTTNQWLVSPDIDLSSGGPYQVEFDLSLTDAFNQNAVELGDDDVLYLALSNDFGASWIPYMAWDSAAAVVPSGEHITGDLSAYDGDIVRFGFYVTAGEISDIVQFNAFVDNFRVQSADSPLSVELHMIVEPNCFQFGGNPLGDALINISGGQAPYIFEWSDGSSNEDLVDVEGGAYTLTVTDGNGEIYTSDPFDIPGTPELTAIATVTDETYDGAGDGTITITEVEGGQGPYTYSWNLGQTTASIDGLIDAFWCVVLMDANNCQTDTCFEILQGPPSFLFELDADLGISLYPNPMANGQSNLSLDLNSGDKWQVEVFDVRGAVVLREQLIGRAMYNGILDLSAYNDGLYTLRIIREDDGAFILRSLIK